MRAQVRLGADQLRRQANQIAKGYSHREEFEVAFTAPGIRGENQATGQVSRAHLQAAVSHAS